MNFEAYKGNIEERFERNHVTFEIINLIKISQFLYNRNNIGSFLRQFQKKIRTE